MKTFRVIYRSGNFVELEVKANTEEEAIAIAEKTDGGDFNELAGSYVWELDRVEEK
jgi:hypothetical protein